MIDVVKKWAGFVRGLAERFNKAVKAGDRTVMKEVVDNLAEGIEKVDLKEVRLAILWALSSIAEKHPEMCKECVPQVGSVVADELEDPFIQVHALDCLRHVGKISPDLLNDFLDKVIKLTTNDFDILRSAAGRVLDEAVLPNIHAIKKNPSLERELILASKDPDANTRRVANELLEKLK
ncbi:MAG: hypothetical protein Kow0069_01430 [Promethearchaeota archaeon]